MGNRRGDGRERKVPRKDTHSLEVILREREETESLLHTMEGRRGGEMGAQANDMAVGVDVCGGGEGWE